MKHKIIQREQTWNEPFIDSTCIEIQVITEITNEDDFYDLLKTLYLESAEVSDVEVDRSDFNDEGMTGNYIDLLYSQEINNGENAIYGIRINHPSLGSFDWDSVGNFFDTFLIVLRAEVDVIWKFQDDFLRYEYPKIYREIYDLENKLREIISFIFAYKYYPLSNQKLIGEHNVNHALKGKDWKEVEEDMENIFYYLTFEDYSKLDGSALKDPTSMLMRDFLEKSNDFEEFKDLLLSRGITEEVHKDFLLSIKENLLEIGMIRNAIMHGRNISEDNYTNYTIAKEKIQNKINEFEEHLLEI